MSSWLQLLTGIAFGSLMLTLAWRFNNSAWTDKRVVDLLRKSPSVQDYLAAEMARCERQRRQYDQLVALFQRDAERLMLRIEADRQTCSIPREPSVGNQPKEQRG